MPEIYVASLADYYGGRLHGEWIDVSSGDVEAAAEDVRRMLWASPLAVEDCRECGHDRVSHAEVLADLPALSLRHDYVPLRAPQEWAIHDFDGFGQWSPEEGESLSAVCRVAEAIAEHGEAVTHWIAHHCDVDAIDTFTDAYEGVHESGARFAEEFAIEIGDVDPEADITCYIDWNRYWHGEYECNGWFISGGHVFRPV